MSALEYQKASGQMGNLDFLKRNKKAMVLKEEKKPDNVIMSELTDQQLAAIAKNNAPRKLGEIKPIGGKKAPESWHLKPLDLPNDKQRSPQQSPQHMESTATMMGMQSMKTTDNTAVDFVVNPSMAQLNCREIDEDSILRDVMGGAGGAAGTGESKYSSSIMASNNKKSLLINEQDQKQSPPQTDNIVNNNDEFGDTMINSKDFDTLKSPDKLECDIEKMMDELGKINQEDEWN